MLPKALIKLIDELGNLPGVGARTAERYAYFLLKTDERTRQQVSSAIANISEGVKLCPVTFALIDHDQEVSKLYSDFERNKKLIAVVEEPFDIVALERTGQFKGTYHVLGGVLSPIDGITPEQLHIPELLKRLKDDEVEELILATNSSVEGESTALFVKKRIEDAGLKVKTSRLARGIPAGVDLEYTDQITLSHALEGRKTL
ncbi:recombination protein RecR [Candidatus Saccharibacteria bacterium RIFCSPHIGHO2_12_FULL_42_8]|nr:MAG: recombination protein RecR [Candidatus Saccharibacteria bacterium RIFCSPHIGHO2_12_FULL_42_8]